MKKINDPATVHQGVEEQECKWSYIETVIYLLNSLATEDVIEKASTEIRSFENRSNQKAMQFADALKHNTLRSENTFSKQRTKSILVYGLPLIVRDYIRMCWVAIPMKRRY